MDASNLPLNPWLAGRIRAYREQKDDKRVRLGYWTQCHSGNAEPWADYLAACALREAFRNNPRLTMRCLLMDLPYMTKFVLYCNQIDTLADLVQYSEEELDALMRREPDLKPKHVRQCLSACGESLCHSPVRTRKIPALRVMEKGKAVDYPAVMLASPGAQFRFDLSRPVAFPDWLDAFILKFDYRPGEDMLREKYMGLQPAPEDGLPADYSDYFNAAREFFAAYEKVCQSHQIWPVTRSPYIPEGADDLIYFKPDLFIYIHVDVVRALLSVLSCSGIMPRADIAAYLGGTDEERIEVAERYENDSDFQMMLASHVGVSIYIDNLLIYFRERTEGKKG